MLEQSWEQFGACGLADLQKAFLILHCCMCRIGRQFHMGRLLRMFCGVVRYVFDRSPGSKAEKIAAAEKDLNLCFC